MAGTDPQSPDYWGSDLGDYDQVFVEMGALTAFLYETKATFWDNLSVPKQKKRLLSGWIRLIIRSFQRLTGCSLGPWSINLSLIQVTWTIQN
nr:DUF2264 domain-containing protein [Lentilactobacillus kisonensis]